MGTEQLNMDERMMRAWKQFRDTELLEAAAKHLDPDDDTDRAIAAFVGQLAAEAFRKGWEAALK